jgi:hypothetical protein
MMNGNECRTVRREIDTSELGQRLSAELEMHLAGCAACEKFRTERLELRALVGSLKPVAAPADFDLRLRARIARQNDPSARQHFIFRFAMTTPAIAAAALIVLTIASIVWINQRKPAASISTANAGPNTEKVNRPAPPPGNEAVVPEPKEPVVASNNPSTNSKRPNPTGRAPGNVLPVSVNTATQVSEFNTRGAQSIRQTRDRAGEVSLTAPSKPMIVSVQDANGATHKILMPPISFGSQRLDNHTPVSMTNRKDW